MSKRTVPVDNPNGTKREPSPMTPGKRKVYEENEPDNQQSPGNGSL